MSYCSPFWACCHRKNLHASLSERPDGRSCAGRMQAAVVAINDALEEVRYAEEELLEDSEE